MFVWSSSSALEIDYYYDKEVLADLFACSRPITYFCQSNPLLRESERILFSGTLNLSVSIIPLLLFSDTVKYCEGSENASISATIGRESFRPLIQMEFEGTYDDHQKLRHCVTKIPALPILRMLRHFANFYWYPFSRMYQTVQVTKASIFPYVALSRAKCHQKCRRQLRIFDVIQLGNYRWARNSHVWRQHHHRVNWRIFGPIHRIFVLAMFARILGHDTKIV